MYSFSYPAEHFADFPAVSASEMQAIDNAMLEADPLTLYQMMEHAGTAVAEVAECYTSQAYPKVAVLVGKGNNGGGALVAARHLANRGAKLQVILTTPAQQAGEAPATQLRILTALHPQAPVHDMSQVTAVNLPPLPDCDIILDGMLGYNIRGVPREPISTLIMIANNAEVPTISVDIPSGLHPDTGEPAPPTILAAATVTLALPKRGFQSEQARKYLGDLYLAGIGIPADIITNVKSHETRKYGELHVSLTYLIPPRLSQKQHFNTAAST